jgi:hypothetical protein
LTCAMDDSHRVTITVCGDGGCGKSSITLRLVRSQWTHEYVLRVTNALTIRIAIPNISPQIRPNNRRLLLRHPHHRRHNLLPPPNRHRRPRRIPRPLVASEPQMRRFPPRLRHHAVQLTRSARLLHADDRHRKRRPDGAEPDPAGVHRRGE